MKYPTWLSIAFNYRGVKEIPGRVNSNIITGWLAELHAWWSDDETPWCGVFVGICLKKADIKIPTYYMTAKKWLDWGVPVFEPSMGTIVIFGRQGGGHVGFVVGRDHSNNLWVLGGNQGNAVSVALFKRDRVLGFRNPESMQEKIQLALTEDKTAVFSKDEA